MAQQTITGKAVASIMNSRILVPSSMVGRSIVLTVQGNGNVLDVRNKKGEEVESYLGGGDVFQKKVFNCKANSEVAMRNPRNKAILMSGIKAERSAAGTITFTLNDKEGAKEYSAHDLYNAYLNKVQFSFNIPLPSPIADTIGDRDEISAKVQLIKTDAGELLTLDPKSIKVLDPEVLGTTKFSLPDFEEEDDYDPIAAITDESLRRAEANNNAAITAEEALAGAEA
jgi:hypothetical protein